MTNSGGNVKNSELARRGLMRGLTIRFNDKAVTEILQDPENFDWDPNALIKGMELAAYTLLSDLVEFVKQPGTFLAFMKWCKENDTPIGSSPEPLERSYLEDMQVLIASGALELQGIQED
jgi:hypothetical protein